MSHCQTPAERRTGLPPPTGHSPVAKRPPTPDPNAVHAPDPALVLYDATSALSGILSRPHDSRDRAGQLLPFRLLCHQLLLSSRGEPVVLEFPFQILPRGFPLRRNPPFAFQAVECRVERSVLDLQQVFCRSLDVLRNLMSMSGTKQQRPQDQHVQRPLQQLDTVGGFVRHSVSRYSTQKSATLGRRPTKWLVSNQPHSVPIPGSGRGLIRSG